MNFFFFFFFFFESCRNDWKLKTAMIYMFFTSVCKLLTTTVYVFNYVTILPSLPSLLSLLQCSHPRLASMKCEMYAIF